MEDPLLKEEERDSTEEHNIQSRMDEILHGDHVRNRKLQSLSWFTFSSVDPEDQNYFGDHMAQRDQVASQIGDQFRNIMFSISDTHIIEKNDWANQSWRNTLVLLGNVTRTIPLMCDSISRIKEHLQCVHQAGTHCSWWTIHYGICKPFVMCMVLQTNERLQRQLPKQPTGWYYHWFSDGSSLCKWSTDPVLHQFCCSLNSLAFLYIVLRDLRHLLLGCWTQSSINKRSWQRCRCRHSVDQIRSTLHENIILCNTRTLAGVLAEPIRRGRAYVIWSSLKIFVIIALRISRIVLNPITNTVLQIHWLR